MQKINGSRFALGMVLSYFLLGCGEHHDEHTHDDSDHGANSAHAQIDSSTSDGSSSNDLIAGGHDDHSNHDSDHANEIRQSSAHLHGDAKLAVAVEGNTLFIELDTPIYNLTGFEHSPATPGEISEQERVESLLAIPQGLFSINSQAVCEPQNPQSDIRLKFAEEPKSAEHDGDHGNHGGSDREETHRDVLFEYHFDCQFPQAIKTIKVHLFQLFPRIEELDAIYLDQTTQQSEILRPDQPVLNINP